MPDVTNPGLVNVADQGDGPLSVDQTILVTPSQNPDSQVPAVAGGLGGGVRTVNNPGLVDVVDEDDVQGTGLPRNVFVP